MDDQNGDRQTKAVTDGRGVIRVGLGDGVQVATGLEQAARQTSTGAGQSDPQTYAIIGAAMEVHRELGPGFLESVYGDALALELQARSIPFAREVPCPVHYKKQRLDARFAADFLCHGRIILELKATRGLGDADTAQALNYLKATGLRRALLPNFGGASLQHRRVVLGEFTSIAPPDFSA